MFQKQLNNTAKAICLTVCPGFKVQKQSRNSPSCSCIKSRTVTAGQLLLFFYSVTIPKVIQAMLGSAILMQTLQC